MYNYFVVADHPNLKEIIHQDLHSETGSDFVPDRSVECTDCQPGSLYNGIFLLTEAEAEILKKDPRIRDVHRIPEEDDVFIQHCGTRAGQYDKGISLTSAMKNWGLSRCINKTDNFGFLTSITEPYTFNLDGTGIDVIIMDSGVDPGHPEFAVNADGTGGSRVVNYDWSQHGLLSEPVGGWLGDCDGHGSNCASIAAGNTCGWAPKARIYSLRCIPSNIGKPEAEPERDMTTGAVLELLSDQLAWQTIRLFHRNKPIDPTTGYRRPTVVNASYAYFRRYAAQLSSVRYRGINYSINTTTNNYGTINIPGYGDTGKYPARVSSVDADIEACIAAGVIVVASAGNYAHKIDIPTGPDYNNFILPGSYYHRGSTPAAATGVICVGAVDSTEPEHKTSYSNTGPRIDIFAPGDNIVGAYRNAPFRVFPIQDPRNTTYYLNKMSGTSQASPQVAGVASLLLQARPWMTTRDILNIIAASSTKNLLSETFYWDYDVKTNGTTYAEVSTGTYTNLSSLQGGVNGYLYMPFNQPITMTIG
jgi:subtilisin family serine protease